MKILLPYQQRWIADRSRVKICAKSRRVGITWAEAVDKLLDAVAGKNDAWYIGYNEDQALEFIRDVEWWAWKLDMVQPKAKEQYLDQDGRDIPYMIDETSILAFRLECRSGKRITALSSRPRNLRGKSGAVIIDEAAFHDQLDELLKAATALLMWGGRVSIISTHNGADNKFNKLIEDVRSGKLDYSLHEITLDDALAEGLYERICLMTGQPYSLEAQEKWRQELIDIYGAGAGEELFCEPLSLSEGTLFNRSWFEILDDMPHASQLGTMVRFWDLAATAKKKGNDPDLTGGVRLVEYGDRYIIDDVIMVMDDPGAVEALVTATARQDGYLCTVGYEEEGGSSGKLYSEHLRQGPLQGFRFEPRRSTGDKITRAKPLSTASKSGKVLLRRAPWNQDFLTILHQFPFGRYDDPVDAASGAWNLLVGEGSAMATMIKAMEKI